MATAADEIEVNERANDDDAVYVRPREPKDPAQVYTVRIPVAQIARLRDIANRQGIAPSTLMRNWVIERLDAEEVRGDRLDFTVDTRTSVARVDAELAAMLRRSAE